MKSLLIILIYIFLLFGCSQPKKATTQTNESDFASKNISNVNSSSHLASLNDKLTIANQNFRLYKIEKLFKGWGAYYAIGDEPSDDSESIIIINYYLPTYNENDIVSAESIASQVLQQNESNGMVILNSYTLTDPANTTQNAFYISMLKPDKSHNDLWFTKIAQDGSRVYSLLFKKKIEGYDSEMIKNKTEVWVLNDLEFYSTELEKKLKPNTLWFNR